MYEGGDGGHCSCGRKEDQPVRVAKLSAAREPLAELHARTDSESKVTVILHGIESDLIAVCAGLKPPDCLAFPHATRWSTPNLAL